MAGDLPVRSNAHVEAWGSAREHVEHTFRFNKRTAAILGVAVVAIPYVVYKLTVNEQNMADDRAGKARKTML